MKTMIRRALQGDAGDISAIISRALRETNAKDYTNEVIERIERTFSPFAMIQLINKRTVFVATVNDRIVGAASLDGALVQAVFVSPDLQGEGIGKRLMAQIERTARKGGISVLTVPSSITAESFYAQVGFRAVGESCYDDERTIIMERSLD
jgi:N-acetylglutamate synthase-like GNAT family acetyltransferase